LCCLPAEPKIDVSLRPALPCGPFRFKERIERMKTILITGAAGDVGGHLRRELAGKYNLRLSDIKPITTLAPGEKSARGDVSKLVDMLRVTKGVDAILHLGGFSFEGPWEEILRANIVGCYNVFEAARRNGVKRVLFASSNHAAGFYKRDQKIDHRVYPKPDSRYGLSKVFGEQLGSLYADKYGMEVFCMRIGNVNVLPADKRRLSIWVSPRDLAQLVSVGIENPNISFEIVYGVSDNKRSWYDNANAHRLGYRPRDDAEQHAAEVLAKEKPGDARAEMHQGGNFVFAEMGGDPTRVAPPPRMRVKAGKAAATGRSAIGKNAIKRKAAKKPAKPKKK
jgi:uronate dehydrogenase